MKRIYGGREKMMARAVLRVAFLFLTVVSYGQASSGWPCAEEVVKAEGDNRRIRVSTGVAQAFAKKKVLPDVSDLKHSRLDSTVVLKLLIGKDGTVRCAEAEKGDTTLLERSAEAAKQWRFRPYLLNGQPVIVETKIEFLFKKGKVTAP